MLLQETSRPHLDVGKPKRDGSRKIDVMKSFRIGKGEIVEEGEMRCLLQTL